MKLIVKQELNLTQAKTAWGLHKNNKQMKDRGFRSHLHPDT